MSQQHRNTAGVQAYNRKKSLEAATRVHHAIQALLRENRAVNFHAISVRSGVSKSYLYRNEELFQQIDNLRKQQYDYDSPLDEYSLIEEQYRTQIRELLQKIKVLEEQNAHLMTLLYQTYENTADK
ncbi:hypothetical protein BACCIP111899_02738 [Bacillus rhizoplanae]|uniref:Transposase n=1 Tax=Bacillus rhizoplanae TaxID=2880966 RepID=A0ABN8A1Z2_9BACI|nr:DUF6262 family protein [Bacillus rhizoplanae]CAG9613523.1 hypothetical protein BACCIP111899_02738 [Bacillus rhizoplanae]